MEELRTHIPGQGRSLRTQISGRYNYDNLRLFEFKKSVQAAGVRVTFPVGDAILKHEYGFASTTSGEGAVPFWLTETKFLQDIQDCDVQITYNLRNNEDGYVGESTAVETAFALVLEKPTIILRPITSFSPRVPGYIRDLLLTSTAMPVLPLDRLSRDELRTELERAIASDVARSYSFEDRMTVEGEAFRLVGAYHAAWLQKLQDDAAAA